MNALTHATQPQLFGYVVTVTILLVCFAVRLWLRVYRAAMRDEVRQNESGAYYPWDTDSRAWWLRGGDR